MVQNCAHARERPAFRRENRDAARDWGAQVGERRAGDQLSTGWGGIPATEQRSLESVMKVRLG